MSKILLGNLKGPQGNPGPKGDPGSTGSRGSRWVTGTAIDGISTTPTAYPTGIADSMVNDHYLNPNSGYIYRCQVAGNDSTAKWVWVGHISNTDGTQKVIVDKTQPKITPEISYSFTNKVTKCVYGADVFVAISGGILYYSTYGKAWRRVTDMESESDKFMNIVYGNGKFVAFANRFSNIPYSYIYYSYDGKKWFYTDKYIKPVAQTIYSNEKFIAISNYSGALTAYYSNDGENWSEGSMSFDFDDSICHLGIEYVRRPWQVPLDRAEPVNFRPLTEPRDRDSRRFYAICGLFHEKSEPAWRIHPANSTR